MLADFGRGGHRLERLGAHVFGVRRRVADPVDAVDRADRTQQVAEERPGPAIVGPAVAAPPGVTQVGGVGRAVGGGDVTAGEREVAPEAVDVLSEERDLTHAVGGELLGLGHQLAERPRDLGASNRRDDAERTAVVAADLDGEPPGMIDLTNRRQRRRERLGVVSSGRLEDLDDRAMRRGMIEQFDRSVHIVGAEHHVDVAGPVADRGRVRQNRFAILTVKIQENLGNGLGKLNERVLLWKQMMRDLGRFV